MSHENIAVAVSQIGARRHYAVPSEFDKAGMLSCLYTDVYLGNGLLRSVLNLIPDAVAPVALRRLMGRKSPIDREKVRAFTRFGLALKFRQRKAKTMREKLQTRIWMGRTFSDLVAKRIPKEVDVVYSYKHEAEILFRRCHDYGIKCILDQMALPRQLMRILMHQEHELWPDWEEDPFGDAYNELNQVLIDQENNEWDWAHRIIAPSEFVQDGLREIGVPSDKCCLIPHVLADSWIRKGPKARRREGPLRVLFVGTVGLLKGVQYVLQAAERLGKSVEVAVIGPIRCREQVVRKASPGNTILAGQVPRIEIEKWYEWADAFCLPSICEGSATVTFEALAKGLPVICTKNAGSVVTDGVDGFIVPIRDAESISEKLHLLSEDKALLETMSLSALKKIENYTLDTQQPLLACLEQLVS